MCGFFAFSIGMSALEIAEELGVSSLPTSIEQIQSLKFYPKSTIPTISKNSPNQLIMRHWSLVPRWWKGKVEDIKFSTFNARSEDIEEKATYSIPWKLSQRCLIPSTWFYEFSPVKEGSKTVKLPFKVQDTQSEIITLAGLYEVWKDSEGKELQSATIITCASVKPLSEIHERQPVIIEKKNREAWLSKNTSEHEVQKLLRPSKKLEYHQINRDFNKAFGRNVTEELIKPIDK